MIGRIFCILFILLLFPFLSSLFPAAVIYKWTDPGGVIHFSDRSEDIPQPFRNNFEIVTEYPEINEGVMIPFEKTPLGLISVNALLNGQVKARLIVDTGANFIVITEELAKKLNQDFSPGRETTKFSANSGEVEGTFFVIRRVELDGAWKENVQAVIARAYSDLRGFDGLLGLSFLEDFKVTVDYPNGRVILRK